MKKELLYGNFRTAAPPVLYHFSVQPKEARLPSAS